MTRVGLGYVAMAAAGISVAVLGYAVIWAYGAPPAVVSASVPHEQSPVASAVAPAPATAAIPAPAAVTEPAPPAKVDQPHANPKQDGASAKAEFTPDRPAQMAQAIPLPPASRIEKPGAVSASKDTRTADRPVTPKRVVKPEASTSALPLDPPQAAARSPAPATQQVAKRETTAAPAPSEKIEAPLAAALPTWESSAITLSAQAGKAFESPAAAAAPVPKGVAAEPGLPAAGSTPETTRPAAVSIMAMTEAPSDKPAAVASDKPASLSAPAGRATAEPRLKHFRSVAPGRRDGRSAIAIPPSASPAIESPAIEMLPAASPSVPSNDATVAPPQQPERPEASLAPSKAPDRPAKPHPRMAALPPHAVIDAPSVTIIRGSRRPTVAHHPRGAEKQKVAALPSGAAATRTATDAPPILVLRGVRRAHYALANAPQGAPEPLLTVIRGVRLRPVLLQHYVQPNALILHIHR